jgi:outer membrane protein TolC
VQPFATGTNLEVNFLGNRNRTTNFFSSLIPAVRTQFDFLLRQDLLQGFGKRDAEYEIEISQNALDITTEDFRESVIDTVVQVQDWFWELEYSLNDIDVRRKALEYAKTVLEQNGARFEVGTAARLEVVEAEAEVASRNEELIRAQFTYRRVQDQLVRLITNYEDPRIFLAEIVPDSALKPFDKEEESFEKLMDLAGELRPEIQRADLDIKKFNLRLRQSRDKLKPKLGLVAGYQWYGLGGTEIVRDYSLGFFDAPVVAVNPGGLWDSMGQLVSGDFNGYVVGLTLDLPIQNLAARASNAKAQLDLRRAKTEKSATRQRIALEIRDALTQLQMNEATLNAAKVAVRAAQERLLGEEARFEVGMGTTRELIEAQRDLLQAKSLEVRAQTDLKKSHSILDKAVGRTLIRQNIRIKEALDLNVKDTGD